MTTFSTSREISATVEDVFAAISNPERLSRWWGPAGFTNTFSLCEFKNGDVGLLSCTDQTEQTTQTKMRLQKLKHRGGSLFSTSRSQSID